MQWFQQLIGYPAGIYQMVCGSLVALRMKPGNTIIPIVPELLNLLFYSVLIIVFE